MDHIYNTCNRQLLLWYSSRMFDSCSLTVQYYWGHLFTETQVQCKTLHRGRFYPYRLLKDKCSLKEFFCIPMRLLSFFSFIFLANRWDVQLEVCISVDECCKTRKRKLTSAMIATTDEDLILFFVLFWSEMIK